MKGLEEIEFIISVFVFITSLSFATVLIVNNIPTFHNVAAAEGLKAKSWQYSDMLLLDEGSPQNWPTTTEQRIGLSTGSRYIVDIAKIQRLASLCSSDYNAVKSLLGMDVGNDIIIEATYLDEAPVAASRTLCKPAAISNLRQQAQITRLAVLNTADSPIIRINIAVM